MVSEGLSLITTAIISSIVLYYHLPIPNCMDKFHLIFLHALSLAYESGQCINNVSLRPTKAFAQRPTDTNIIKSRMR